MLARANNTHEKSHETSSADDILRPRGAATVPSGLIYCVRYPRVYIAAESCYPTYGSRVGMEGGSYRGKP
jgi:hypothetical protein